MPGLPDNSHGGAWDGRVYLSHYHAGLWVVDIESLMVAGLDDSMNRSEAYSYSTVGFHSPHAGESTILSSDYYDFGWVPFLWAAEYHEGYTYLSCITSGLYIVQLDIDKPYTTTLQS